MQTHYNFVFDSIASTYVFTTKNNIQYTVAFINDEIFSSISKKEISNIFQIVVEKAGEEKEPLDNKVSKTIEAIIEQFFLKIENSLIYVCYDLDQKANLRYKVFDRWYDKSYSKSKILKLDKIINIYLDKEIVQKLFTSFMFHKKNSNHKELVEIYNKIEEVINLEK